MPFSTTRRAGRMLRQQLISLCARVHKNRGIRNRTEELEDLKSFDEVAVRIFVKILLFYTR